MAKKRSRSKKRSKKYQIELTPLSILLWGGCLFFVLSWIFVLGILVGRGFLPGAVTALSDLKNQIGVLQQMVSREKPAKDLNPPKKPDSDPKLAFYDKLSSKKEESLKERVAPRNAKKSTRKKADPKRTNSPPQFSPKRESLGAQKGTVQNRVGISKAVRLEKKERGEPSAPKAKYTVQLASLDEKNKAESFISDLAQRGYPAYFYEAKVKGKTYYRVRCGKFPSRKAAEDYASKLRREAGMKGFVSRIE
ncbi:MAG: SPOR domain-containing protein [Desulfobacteraceae bacterium]|jgi:cell division septation protein DedD